jgi:hypothetical protein
MSRDRISSPQVQMSNSNNNNNGSGSGGVSTASLSHALVGTQGMKTASLNEIWEDLRRGIESVYQQQTMSKSAYIILYT